MAIKAVVAILFSMFSSGGHFVQCSGTKIANFLKREIR